MSLIALFGSIFFHFVESDSFRLTNETAVDRGFSTWILFGLYIMNFNHDILPQQPNHCSCEMMKERRICLAIATGATQGTAAESFYRAEAISHAKGVVL